MPSFGERFARQYCDQLPPRFHTALLLPGIVHHLSGPATMCLHSEPCSTKLGSGVCCRLWDGHLAERAATIPHRPWQNTSRDGWAREPCTAHVPHKTQHEIPLQNCLHHAVCTEGTTPIHNTMGQDEIITETPLLSLWLWRGEPVPDQHEA